jgi:hypothetical protein
MRYRHHNQNTALRLMYRRIKNLEKLKYKVRTGRLNGKVLESGFTRDQTWGGLCKAWAAYIISDKKDDLDRKQYYAAVIQKLQHELGMTVRSFPELNLMAMDFYLKNLKDTEKDDQDLTGEEVMQLMRKSDDEFWKKVRGEDRRRSY